jgi:hypothetical protein
MEGRRTYLGHLLTVTTVGRLLDGVRENDPSSRGADLGTGKGHRPQGRSTAASSASGELARRRGARRRRLNLPLATMGDRDADVFTRCGARW